MIDVMLQQGEYYVADATRRIRTLLGSCVSITLWHPGQRIGAMSHFLLSNGGAANSGALDARYAEDATALMLRDLAARGVPHQECVAKIFGGGNMFPDQVRADARSVGQQNGEVARALMRSYGIAIVSESLFGIGHRQIIFDVSTGHVWSRQVQPRSGGTPDTKEA